MKRNPNTFIAALMSFAFVLTASEATAQEIFVTGLDDGYTFSAAQCGSAARTGTITTHGKTFKIMTFYYEGSSVTAIEDASGRRSLIFKDGKPDASVGTEMDSFPLIGFNDGKELESNCYSIGSHDFTDDGQPELVVAVKNASGDGMAIFIFGWSGSWKCTGEMMVYGHNVRSSRVFRQTVTIKDADSGILYTWTWHDGKFDFLSSDRRNDPEDLY